MEKMNRDEKRTRTMAPAVIAILQAYDWPGNIRELKNVVEGAWIEAEGGVITTENPRIRALVSQPAALAGELPEPAEGFEMLTYLEQVRQGLLEKALAKAGGNRSRAANLLGITPQAVSKHCQAKALPRDEGPSASSLGSQVKG